MRKIFLLLLVAFVLWLAFNRERIFIRDPIAAVYRNDAKQTGVEVYFNFSNDILLQQGSATEAQRTILQHWDRMPGTPARLVCIRWVACLTDADHAPLLSPANGKASRAPQTQMNGRHITFLDPHGARLRVDL